MSSAFVSFNISGVQFRTLRETVLKEPTSRLALLVRGVLPANLDTSGAIFIDRDAKYFQLVSLSEYFQRAYAELANAPFHPLRTASINQSFCRTTEADNPIL
jgi:hypothetical protein